jgi:sugar phosphate isomerase/epimerase
VRTLPGQGELPLGDFVRAADAAGYTGPFEIEFLGSAEVDRDAIVRSLNQSSETLRRILVNDE